MASSAIVISRCDKLGDLILSLPAIAHLKRNVKVPVYLHLSEYASAIGEMAVENGLCDAYFYTDHGFLKGHSPSFPEEGFRKVNSVISLFHCDELSWFLSKTQRQPQVFFPYTLGPRSRISSLWTYKWSITQNRSRVEKSEMLYNVDLVDAYLKKLLALEDSAATSILAVSAVPFQGLSPLRLPEGWGGSSVASTEGEFAEGDSEGEADSVETSAIQCCDVLMVVSNGNSAANWSMIRYVEEAERLLEQGLRVDVLLHGHDSEERGKALAISPIAKHPNLKVIETFADLKDLIIHISNSKKVIASSTGPLHIAHALGKPVKAIYPLTPKVQSFERWRPHGYWHDAPVEWVHV